MDLRDYKTGDPVYVNLSGGEAPDWEVGEVREAQSDGRYVVWLPNLGADVVARSDRLHLRRAETARAQPRR